GWARHQATREYKTWLELTQLRAQSPGVASVRHNPNLRQIEFPNAGRRVVMSCNRNLWVEMVS
ncbi:MAG: hypothetical protein KDA92_15685, partial [Planctomycetales bacterium]|nr:hypothetical protein [Planctomycetales bacterium]